MRSARATASCRAAAPLAVFQIVSVTTTSAADANTSRLRVCVMAVCWGGWGDGPVGARCPQGLPSGHRHRELTPQ